MGKVRYENAKSKASEFLALTSLSIDEFEILVPHFEKAYQVWCEQGKEQLSDMSIGKLLLVI